MNDTGKQSAGGAAGGEAQPWHAMAAAEVLSALNAGEQGLTGEEAARRIEEHGPNALPQPQRAGPLRRFLRQFDNMLIYILLAAAVFTAYLREWVDTIVILAVVLINALIGLIQEGKAERAMESIRGMLAPTATALRDGEELDLQAAELVPGDIVSLSSGGRVPADLRVLWARNAQLQEASLTGESEPVTKRVDPVEPDMSLGDRASMAFSSTLLTSGQLRGVVVATGPQAEIGRVSEMVSQVQELRTPLLRKIDRFGRQLSLAIVAASAAFFLLGYFLRDFSASAMFMAVVALVVAAIPEGLPAIMTITLARGVQHMARQHAIVRRLPAVETLGAVTVICSDKTGTLTRNEMTVAKVATAEHLYSISGSGYAPEGQVRLGDEAVSIEQHPQLLELARGGLLASDARVRQEQDGAWQVDGAPTEGAMVVLARKLGLEREEELAERQRLDVIPFESERRFMASLHAAPGAGALVYVKGAPERVLELCARQASARGEEALDREAWQQREVELASGGHRVLAVASRQLEGGDSLDEQAVQELTLLGLVGILDPPREEAIGAVKQCQKAGIAVKMITGDHALTARSIGAAMGIGDGTHAVTGRDLELADDAERDRLVRENEVFARASPEHKLRMVESLQAQGHVIAMTGDGVNDAPALKRADVGVAMGIKGTEATKEAADIVLGDDNFATIELAVESGRSIYDNLVKTIVFMLPTNGAEALMVVGGVLILFEVMPITPLQILWVNMVTAVTLALALAFEPAEEGIMRRPPRPPDEPIISGYLIWRILFVSVLIAMAATLLFTRSLAAGASVEVARTVAVNTLVAGQAFYLFNSRFLAEPSLRLHALIGNRQALVAVGLLVALQLGFTYLGPAQRIFGTAALGAVDALWIIAAGFAVFLLVEAEKLVLRRRQRRRQRRVTEPRRAQA